MLSDKPTEANKGSAFDVGLLAPVTVNHDVELRDEVIVGALAAAEVALVRSWARLGVVSEATADEISVALGWQGVGTPCKTDGLPVQKLVSGAVSGGNPVIPLVGILRDLVREELKPWVHRGATSQDILDSALMLVARNSCANITHDLRGLVQKLVSFIAEHNGKVVAARTLTQHAVPTTIGLRTSGWLRAVQRSLGRLEHIAAELPAQLAGAGGTLASFQTIAGAETAIKLPAAFAKELGLSPPEAPWHTQRWPVTELGDALTQVTDALGVIAADVATLSRSEIGELAEGTGGGSSVMPQKRNPARSVLIRSAAIRAPHLAATLHTAAALTVDERPDGAWHAEWPALRELLRIARGAAAHARDLVAGLGVDDDAVKRNLALSGGLIVAERLSLELGPVIGTIRVQKIISAVGVGADLSEELRAIPELQDLPIAKLIDPQEYLGLASEITTQTIRDATQQQDQEN